MASRRRAGEGTAAAPLAALPSLLGRPQAWSGLRLDLRAFLRRCVETEIRHRRLFPWLAVLFGIGILLFFAADGEPSLWAPLLAAFLCAGAAILVRARPLAFSVAVGLAAVFCGFAA